MGIFSRLFKKKTNTPALTGEVRQAFDHMMSILNNDAKQNALMPVQMQETFLKGDIVDEINCAEGPFGRHPFNPIPVNGPLGEITYLSRLITKDNGQHLFFHRLGSGSNIDAYEVVSWDGSVWDVLYFDYYHMGKTRKAPDGYTFAEKVEGITGTNKLLASFPIGINEAAGACACGILGVPLSNPYMRNIKTTGFAKPAAHAQFVQELLDAIHGRQK